MGTKNVSSPLWAQRRDRSSGRSIARKWENRSDSPHNRPLRGRHESRERDEEKSDKCKDFPERQHARAPLARPFSPYMGSMSGNQTKIESTPIVYKYVFLLTTLKLYLIDNFARNTKFQGRILVTSYFSQDCWDVQKVSH